MDDEGGDGRKRRGTKTEVRLAYQRRDASAQCGYQHLSKQRGGASSLTSSFLLIWVQFYLWQRLTSFRDVLDRVQWYSLSLFFKSDIECHLCFIDWAMEEVTTSTALYIEMFPAASTAGRGDIGLRSAEIRYDEERAELDLRAWIGR